MHTERNEIPDLKTLKIKTHIFYKKKHRKKLYYKTRHVTAFLRSETLLYLTQYKYSNTHLMLVLAILKPCIEVLAATDPPGIPQEPRMANTRQKEADSHTSLDTLPSTPCIFTKLLYKSAGFFLWLDI